MPLLIAANKSDASGAAGRLESVLQTHGASFPVVGLSAREKTGLEDLRLAVFESARIIRVYSREPGRDADTGRPFTLPEGSTVLDLAELIHKDFVENLKYACIWGSAKFEGQRVQRDYVLKDRDVVEFHVK